MSYLRHKHGAGWKEETKHQTEGDRGLFTVCLQKQGGAAENWLDPDNIKVQSLLFCPSGISYKNNNKAERYLGHARKTKKYDMRHAGTSAQLPQRTDVHYCR